MGQRHDGARGRHIIIYVCSFVSPAIGKLQLASTVYAELIKKYILVSYFGKSVFADNNLNQTFSVVSICSLKSVYTMLCYSFEAQPS